MVGPSCAFRWVAVLTALLVLVQAILAGRGWYRDRDLFDVHARIGDILVLVVAALFVIGLVGRRRATVTNAQIGLASVLLVLVIAQLALGYSAGDSRTAGSLHVPNGVLIFGLLSALVALVLPRRAV
jgi:hypothetical protein